MTRQLRRFGGLEETAKVQRTDVVELLPGHRLQDGFDVLDPALQLLVAIEHLGIGWLQDAVKPPDDRERQDDLAVLGLLLESPRSRSATDQMNPAWLRITVSLISGPRCLRVGVGKVDLGGGGMAGDG
jgi:hypothetical protein